MGVSRNPPAKHAKSRQPMAVIHSHSFECRQEIPDNVVRMLQAR
jgi:hypothetical protein